MSAQQQRDYVAALKREAHALRSALGARGVALRDVVAFGRTWDGFAATVDTSDLAALSSLGVRAQPVRRFYPAASEPVPVPGAMPTTGGRGGAGGSGGAPRAAPAAIAILDTGADVSPGRGTGGYDALDRDTDPAPGTDPRAARRRGGPRAGAGGRRRREAPAAARGGIVAGAGERVIPIRVAGFGPASPEVYATSDSLLLGLERAVDPDGDGATDDAARVALVGVNAPYAGFGDSPEAQAARGAARIGTLVVAPAGGEGPARPPNGVVGSPGAARAALTAGAAEAGAGAARVPVTLGTRKLRDAAALGGAPPGGLAPLAGPVTAVDPAVLLRGGPRVAGRVALVPGGGHAGAPATPAGGRGA